MLSTAIQDRAVRARLSARSEASGLDEAGFRSFYDATARPLWAFLSRTCRQPSVADDLLQEAYFRFLRSGFTGDGPEHRKNYLFRIGANLARDHFRRRRPEEPLGDPATGAPETADRGPDPRERAGLSRDLDRVLGRLEPRDRQLVWLAHVEGASHREIAAAVGVQEASVRVLLFRARQKLAGLLREQGLGPGETP
jgi:RNA polymerase sigma-70 factor (ECF subfamily)